MTIQTFADSIIATFGRAQARADDRRDAFAARIYGEAVDIVHDVLAEEARVARATPAQAQVAAE